MREERGGKKGWRVELALLTTIWNAPLVILVGFSYLCTSALVSKYVQ